jgi:mRNA interferase MazF
MTIFEPFDVVEVPFPFSAKVATKLRIALVLSPAEFQRKNRSAVMMMVTSAEHSHWLGDVALQDWQKAKLKKPCKARLKLFTLDTGIVHSRRGKLSIADREAVKATLGAHLPGL